MHVHAIALRLPRVLLLGLVIVAISAASLPSVARSQAMRGGLDRTFGGGRVTTDFGGKDVAYAATIRADGKIIAAGQTDAGGGAAIALARYLPDGSPDTSFGDSGRVVTDLGGAASAYAVRSNSEEGVIYVAGVAGTDFVLLKYDDAGQPDTSFGAGGITRMPITEARAVVYAMWLQRDGKVLIAGNAPFALARFLPDGSLDQDFGEGGVVPTVEDGRSVQGIGVWRGSNDTIFYIRFSGRAYLISRFDPDGEPLEARANDDCDLAGGIDGVYDLDFEPGGKLVVAGVAGGRAALARYHDDCTIDTSFGENGVLRIDTVLEAYYITVVVDNKVLLVGGADGDFALARFETAAPGDMLLSDTFESAGAGVMPSASSNPSRSRLGYTNGEYVVAKVDATWEGSPFATVPGTYADTTIIVDARIVGPAAGRYISLGCRDSDDGYYILVVDVDAGSFRLGRRGQSSQNFVNDEETRAINRGNAVNRLELRCAGNTLTATINGQQVASVNDPNLRQGELFFGVGVYSDQLPGTVEARFDNLRVIRQ